MQYSSYPKLPNIKLSRFGMGIMRMPATKVDGKDVIDRTLGREMVKAALDAGVNYFDTAYPYHDGDSEAFVGEVLEPYYDKIYVATKLPQWLVKSYEDYERYLDEQLDKLKRKSIDFYMIHALSGQSFDKHKEMGLLDFIDKAKADGKIKYPSFSYHGTQDGFKRVIDSYDWIMSMMILNYIDENVQAGVGGMRYAYERGVGVNAMEPLKGGMLVKLLPEPARALFKERGLDPVETAMRWVHNLKEVTVILSGVSTLEQTLGQIKIAENAHPNCLSDVEMDTLMQAKAQMDIIPCSECRYCQPCPQGVDIPAILGAANNLNEEEGKKRYRKLMEEGKGAEPCTACGACEAVCPQKIEIIEEIQKVHERFK